MSIFNNTNCDIFQAPTLNELLEGFKVALHFNSKLKKCQMKPSPNDTLHSHITQELKTTTIPYYSLQGKRSQFVPTVCTPRQ